jgi:acetolactate synthase I/II/III large subunit
MTTAIDPQRRKFLKGSVLAGAAVAASPLAASGAEGAEVGGGKSPDAAPPGPSPRLRVAEVDPVEPGGAGGGMESPQEFISDPGSDFMVDVLRAAGIRHVALMSGSTFRGLHESLINYAGNTNPDIIVCMSEEVSAAAAHGYAKVTGEMMACVVHSNVGLQHASMAIYNAWCDRAPMLVLAANVLDVTQRRPGVEWTHTHEDVGSMVRDFIKWDDTPVSLQHFAESTIRACEFARTPPFAPVLVVADADLQEHNVKDRKALSIPARANVTPPAADPLALTRLADMLITAEKPMIVVDRAIRTKTGMNHLVELAELLQAPVIDQSGRMNMPNTHYLQRPLHVSRMLSQCDMLLGLELNDPWGVVHSYSDLTERSAKRKIPQSAKVALVGTAALFPKPNVQDLQRYYAADLSIGADVEASLPAIIAAVQNRLTPERRTAIAGRESALRQEHATVRKDALEAAALGWDSSPITTARLSVELWEVIEGQPWGLVSDPLMLSGWPLRLWDFTEPHHHIGGSGGYGIGYNIGACVGAALGHKEAGRFAVNLQGDGDLLMLPTAMWSLAHHDLPVLIIVHNNRAWHQEIMHIQRMTNRRNRGIDRFDIGTTITDPPVDHSQLARSMGVWAEGPISDPNKLNAAIRRAMTVVRSGKPALLDVIMEPR